MSFRQAARDRLRRVGARSALSFPHSCHPPRPGLFFGRRSPFVGRWHRCAKSAKDDAIPISYTIDVENGLVISVGLGILTADELFDYLARQVRDPDVPLPLRDLHDLSLAERFDVAADDIRRVSSGLR